MLAVGVEGTCGEQGVLKTGRLPPAEAVLGRKMFRACSVDLAHDAMPESSTMKPFGLNVRREPAKTVQPTPRKVKTAQEPHLLVQEAISKLAQHENTCWPVIEMNSADDAFAPISKAGMVG